MALHGLRLPGRFRGVPASPSCLSAVTTLGVDGILTIVVDSVVGSGRSSMCSLSGDMGFRAGKVPLLVRRATADELLKLIGISVLVGGG